MKQLHVILWLLISINSYGQQTHLYSLEELDTARVDAVFAISLKKMRLEELPTQIFKFKHLRYLDLAKNKLRKVEGIEQFRKLEYLNIEKNELDYFPIQICQLVQLKTLILNRNDFSSIPPCIEQCKQLESVDLWYTAVTSFPEEMKRLKKLKLIDLTGVQINDAGQEKMKMMFPNIKLILSPPCNCMY